MEIYATTFYQFIINEQRDRHGGANRLSSASFHCNDTENIREFLHFLLYLYVFIGVV
jgi:hypothetical protein